ncbi:MAG: ornithine cyclodeaminase family protein [Microbacteriaceae bacterium]|nr:ornithine cyclodeaminase family protein [Microbacteriaceae bacterium]
MPARYFTDDEVAELLTPAVVLESQRAAFTALARGEAVLAPRVLVPGADDAVAFSYVARLTPESAAVSKLGSVNPANSARDLPLISATVHVLDAETGHPAATIEGETLTTLRTAAASALAAQALAKPGARTLGIIGAGVQARAHALALADALELDEIRIAGRSLDHAKDLARELDEQLPVPVRSVVHEKAGACDIVVTCTTSFEAVVETAWVRPGATVISVGAFAPDRQELPASLVDRADRIVVDHRPTSAAQSGPVVTAIEAGSLAADDLVELGDVLIDEAGGRGGDDEIVLYFSVGVGIQDAAAAEALLRAAGPSDAAQ